MAYDLEKYQDKREKVLGVKKRGLSFSTLATLVSLLIILGLGFVVVPGSVAYFNNRLLDDAIYKLQDIGSRPHEIIADLRKLAGVKNVETDSHGSRIIVTFDRTIADVKDFDSYFSRREVQAVLLNRVNRSHRLQTMKKEARFAG